MITATKDKAMMAMKAFVSDSSQLLKKVLISLIGAAKIRGISIRRAADASQSARESVRVDTKLPMTIHDTSSSPRESRGSFLRENIQLTSTAFKAYILKELNFWT